MGNIVQHNMSAMNANRMLSITNTSQKKSTEKLSSGYKINRAGDDAAGLAISEKMRGQIKGLNKASSNAQDGISLIQTAEGALTETHSIIQRMRELAVQSASDTNTDDDRTQIQNEIDQLTMEVDRIANTTEFNTKKLLNGDRKGAVNQKEGTCNIEGTFTNSLVKIDKAFITDGDMLSTLRAVSATDVIRIEIGKDANSEGNVGTVGNVSEYTVKSLHGASAHVTIDSEGVHLAKDLFGKISGSGTANERILLTDQAAAEVIVKLSNGASLKAGDVITITLGEATATESAKAGKEALRLQVGANAGQEVSLGINSMRTQDLDIANKDTGKGLDVTSQSGASLAINAYDMAIQKVSTERAKMGAMQNRLEHTIANLDSAAENTQNSESRIRDTDMASEMVEFSKNNILAQAGQSMLAQANQSNQGVLSLLG